MYAVYRYTNDAPPTLDTTLLFNMITWAEQDEEIQNYGLFAGWGLWNQGSWAINDNPAEAPAAQWVEDPHDTSCQTSYCMAGQAAHQAGYRAIFQGLHSGEACIKQETAGRTKQGYTIWQDVTNAPIESIAIVGRRVLGLTDDEADLFFEGDNELDDLRRLANTFCFGRDLPLLFPNDPIELSIETEYYRIDTVTPARVL